MPTQKSLNFHVFGGLICELYQRRERMTHFSRHPEARAKRASKDGGHYLAPLVLVVAGTYARYTFPSDSVRTEIQRPDDIEWKSRCLWWNS
jgi:hypothetical protein